MAKKRSKQTQREVPVEQALIESLTELRDSLRAGEKPQERFTMRTVELQLEPSDYEADDIRAIRGELSVSQGVFAKLLGVSVKTVQSWEQGMMPPPMARRLLDLMREDPDRWRQILRDATKPRARA